MKNGSDGWLWVGGLAQGVNFKNPFFKISIYAMPQARYALFFKRI